LQRQQFSSELFIQNRIKKNYQLDDLKMFSFLNRNKANAADTKSGNTSSRNANNTIEKSLQTEIEEIEKNLYIAITSRRTDIVVSVLNEWFKGKSSINI
jgi:hypothetical protein